MVSTRYILIVDDDEATCIYFSRQLRQPNLTVVTAVSGQQAIELAKQQPFDLMLLDILMPEMNGFQVLQTFKSDPDLRPISIVMVSSLDDLDTLTRCIELGAEDYLFKPLNPILLKARVHACLERKQLRDQEQAYLEQLRSEKIAAETANRAKSAFLANMSHELRTPLNAIIGYSEILQEDIQELSPDFTTDIEKIRSSSKHLLGLINDILDISKIEAGKMELYLETFEATMLIEDVVKTAQQWLKHTTVLETDYVPNLGTLHTDLSKLRQILLNLLSNAIKFTESGTITLTVKREDKQLEHFIPTAAAPHAPSPTSHLTFQICDTGIGIHPGHQQTIFQAFNQGDSSLTRKYGGTGLGLALCQRFCQMLGGSIEVESTPGKGSTFTVELPVDMIDHQVNTALTHESNSDQAQIEASNLNGETNLVLVIDNDRAVRDWMVQTLNREGFRVVTTWSGEEGVRLARELHPNLIILDLLLPNADSWAILAALKADESLAEIPVIMLTINNNQHKSFLLGLSDYVTKPAAFKRMTTALRHYRRNPTNPALERILLIDEDSTTRQITQRLLEKEGWIVSVTESTEMALALMHQVQPELILLNLMPPTTKGLEFIAHLRHHELWHAIPAMVISTKDISRDDRTGLNDYLETLLQQNGYSHSQLLIELRKLVTICNWSRVCV